MNINPVSVAFPTEPSVVKKVPEIGRSIFEKPGNAGVSSWRQRLMIWFRLKKLEHEIRNSEKFQKQCEKLKCLHLAELEECHRSEIAKKLRQLKATLHV